MHADPELHYGTSSHLNQTETMEASSKSTHFAAKQARHVSEQLHRAHATRALLCPETGRGICTALQPQGGGCSLLVELDCCMPAVNHQKQAKSTLQQQVATGEGLTCCAPRQLALWHLYSA